MKGSTLKIILKNWLLQRRSLPAYIATNTIYRKTDLSVAAGPFKGMKYVENSTGGAYFPKLLGTYEKELNTKIDEFSAMGFEKIINVGGGEGYFAVGLALKNKNAKVLVFEPGYFGCHLIQKMAEMNQVGNRVEIKAQLCAAEDLEKAIGNSEKTFVFMDVEGAELYLLDPASVPGIKKCHIIVEIHDSVPGLGDTIQKRFAGTHKLTEIWQEDRIISDLSITTGWKGILKRQFENLMHEGRGMKMRWFVLEPF